MQDTPHFYYPYYQNTFGEHCYESAHSANFAMSVPHTTPHAFTQTIVPTAISREVELITTGDDSSLSAVPRAAENFGHFSSALRTNALNQTPTIPPLMGRAHYTNIRSLQDQIYDALRKQLLLLPPQYRQSFLDSVSASIREDINLSVRPRWTDGEASTSPAFTSPPNQTTESAISGSFMRPSSSQVPSGTTNRESSREESWLPCGTGDTYHAVEWLARPQRPLLRSAGALPHAIRPSLNKPASFEVENGLISQAPLEPSAAGFGDDLPRMVDPLTGQVPSPPLHHQNQHRSRHFHPRLERTICNKCQKVMLTQSLRRHLKEVHENVKRPRTKSSFIVVTP